MCRAAARSKPINNEKGAPMSCFFVRGIIGLLVMSLCFMLGQAEAQPEANFSMKASLNQISLPASAPAFVRDQLDSFARADNPITLPLEGAGCFTQLLRWLKINAATLDPKSQAMVAALDRRPDTARAWTSPDGNFLLHYDEIGLHAVPAGDNNKNGIPDYVEQGASYLAKTWDTIINQLGYNRPPNDNGGGGDNSYDVYFQRLTNGLYGYTSYSSNGGPSPYDAASYLVLNTYFPSEPGNSDPDGVTAGNYKTTIAHEFFHGIQFGYDFYETIFWMEATSTWMEDKVFNETNSYWNWLAPFFLNPDWPLDTENGQHEYAAMIWPRFLDERFGANVIRKIWSTGLYRGWIESAKQVLLSQGVSLEEAFRQFTTWNYLTGSRDDLNHYSEGSHYPEVTVAFSHQVYPADQTVRTKANPDYLAANYVEFRPPENGSATNLVITFSGDSTAEWRASIVLIKAGMPAEEQEIRLSPAGSGSIEVGRFHDYSKVVLIPAVVSLTGLNYNYSYRAELGQNTPACALPSRILTGQNNTSGMVIFMLLSCFVIVGKIKAQS
jgi:hypothetical protein